MGIDSHRSTLQAEDFSGSPFSVAAFAMFLLEIPGHPTLPPLRNGSRFLGCQFLNS